MGNILYCLFIKIKSMYLLNFFPKKKKNSYLFWTSKFGLYRMDLSKKVYNLKMEMSSMLILQNKDIGPFVIDYLNFCLLVLFQKNNTIMSVSLDG